MTVVGAAPQAETGRAWRSLGVFVAGALVAVLAGVYGRVHDPTGHTLFTLVFTSTLTMKAWLTTAALLLAVVQVLTALRLYGKIKVPARFPPWLGEVHRLSGTLAFLFTIPVGYHCLWSLGFAGHLSDTRRFVHSVLGCAFYGAFATKVLAVRVRNLAGWVLPVVGGLLFTILVALWSTSSLWLFNNVGLHR